MVEPAEARDELARDILALQRRFTALAWRFAGPDVVLPDLTGQQLRVLLLVMRKPGVGAGEVGQSLGVSAPTATGIVERLVDRGLLQRGQDPVDRRMRPLTLTTAGEATLGELDAANEAMFARLVPLLPTSTLSSIRVAYESLLAAVSDAEASEGSSS